MRDFHLPDVGICCIYDRRANVVVNRVTLVSGARLHVRRATLESIACNAATAQARTSAVRCQLGTAYTTARRDHSAQIANKVRNSIGYSALFYSCLCFR